MNNKIRILSAPSILGLKPTGVELMAESLLSSGLREALRTTLDPLPVENLNTRYNAHRDENTQVLNPDALAQFSESLAQTLLNTIEKDQFPFVLGGDCSILIGCMTALKARGNPGLIFLDAHADFYEPKKSLKGEVADMDLAIVTGHGPEVLTNIHGLKPYVKDENVIHVGQRDQEETAKYGSQDIRKTAITCYSLADIQEKSMEFITDKVLKTVEAMETGEFWIHYDTDVLSDQINPAVDYRLPEGLQFHQVEYLLRHLLKTGKITGISTTIFNPRLDKSGKISKNIASSLGRAFDPGYRSHS